MKVMIHGTKERMAACEGIYEELKEQGLDMRNEYLSIIDIKRQGCLAMFRESCKRLEGYAARENVWHLQDDVVLAEDFVWRIRNMEGTPGIICGFASKYDVDTYGNVITGPVYPRDMWYSFPCIRIPVEITSRFGEWIDTEAWTDEDAKVYLGSGKHDDMLFRTYMCKRYPNMPVMNLRLNLVDHRDDLCGGSIVNPDRGDAVRALYFEGARYGKNKE